MKNQRGWALIEACVAMLLAIVLLFPLLLAGLKTLKVEQRAQGMAIATMQAHALLQIQSHAVLQCLLPDWRQDNRYIWQEAPLVLQSASMDKVCLHWAEQLSFCLARYHA